MSILFPGEVEAPQRGIDGSTDYQSIASAGGTEKYEELNGITMTLGGLNNVSGLFTLKDEDGNTILTHDKEGSHYFDSSDVEQYRISRDGFFAAGATTIVIRLRDTVAGDTYGSLGFSTLYDAFGIISGNSKALYMISDADAAVDGDNDSFFMAKGDVFIVSDSEENSAGDVKFVNYNENVYRFWDPGAAGYRTLTMGSNKSAILPTSKGYRALYCMESPELWFMDFCKYTFKRLWPKFWIKEMVLDLDPLFKEVTSEPYIPLKTVIPGIAQVWGKRKFKEGTRFAKMTEEEFKSNDKFWGNATKNTKKPR